ncbi:MAG: DnaD domain protein, partial [Clostridiales bacterium]|nr:DnaD domain protein [Clostridiales bacterium]
MSRTRFISGKRKDIFLYSTTVENFFINEFLPDAPGDFVKVFLYGLMYAQYEQETDSAIIAHTLGMTEKDVDNAWKYWESKGLVSISEDSRGDTGVEFIKQIDLFYGKTIEESYPVGPASDNMQTQFGEDPVAAEESAESVIARMVNRQLKELFDKYQDLTGRTVSRHEARKLTEAVRDFNIEPDVLGFAIDYCIGIEKYSVDYIFKVALRWTEEGCRDVAQVKMMLDRNSKRNEAYRQVFSALGFNRPSNPSDREMMDKWFDEMGFSIGEVLDACKAAAGLRDPNLRYVNRVLENKVLERGGVNTRAETSVSSYRSAQDRKTDSQSQTARSTADESGLARVSRKVLKDYYEYLREEEERNYYARIDEINLRIPEMRDIYTAVNELNRKVISLAPGPDSKENRRRMREKRQDLEDRKRELLVRSGYPEDYLDRKYRCNKCRDTGYTDEGKICTCCRARAEE